MDRFNSSTYSDDPPVGIVVVDDSTERWVAWIPERLWERTLALGAAYRLHVLNLLQDHERLELNQPQVESLLDELQFLGAVVKDDLLAGHLEEIQARSRPGSRRAWLSWPCDRNQLGASVALVIRRPWPEPKCAPTPTIYGRLRRVSVTPGY